VSKNNMLIREIRQEDNLKIATAIREVLIEFGVPKVGTTYADKILDEMAETYTEERKIFFVIEFKNKIYGGAGISQLDNYDGNICELQKMYFKPEARGIGLGSKMITKCLEFAKTVGFEKCYLETMPYMHDARKLYRKVGFKNIDGPMGDTGHYSCSVWMIKDL
jgi:putative acetyltransferase